METTRDETLPALHHPASRAAGGLGGRRRGEVAAASDGVEIDMSLTSISKLDPGTRQYLMLTDWLALDVENGAYLFKTHGYTKGGLGKYILIVKGKQAILDNLVHGTGWLYRSFVRAWSDSEAVETSNQRLEKWLSRR
jgi:hypothetical protein